MKQRIILGTYVLRCLLQSFTLLGGTWSPVIVRQVLSTVLPSQLRLYSPTHPAVFHGLQSMGSRLQSFLCYTCRQDPFIFFFSKEESNSSISVPRSRSCFGFTNLLIHCLRSCCFLPRVLSVSPSSILLFVCFCKD